MNAKHWLIILAAVVLVTLNLNPRIGPNGDDAAYVEFAQGILRGRGLVWTHYPIPERSGYRTFTLPLLILPFERLVPGAYLYYKLIPWAAFLLLGPILLRLWRLPDKLLWLALVLFHPWVIDYTHQLLTEIPFLALSCLLLIGLERWLRRKGWGRRWPLLVLGLYFLIHLKELGYALLAGFVLCGLCRKQWSKTAAFAGLILLLLVADIFVFNLHEGIYLNLTLMRNQYDPGAGAANVGELAFRPIRRAAEYALNRFPDFFLLPYFHAIDPHLPDKTINPFFIVKAVPGLLLALLMLRGFVRRWRQGPFLTEWYFLFFFLILLVWQSALPRYLIPITPLLFGYLFTGARGLPRRLPWRLAFVALFVLQLGTTLQMSREAQSGYLLPHWQAYYDASRWAAGNLPPDAVILCRKPGITWLVAKRHTADYPLETSPAALQAVLTRYGVTHVLIDELAVGEFAADRYLRPALRDLRLHTVSRFHAGNRTELLELARPERAR